MRKKKSIPRFIPVARPWFSDAETKAVRDVLRSGWVTQGPEVAAFEREFADYVGAPFACAVSSCTTALHLALKAVGVGAGDEVITVSHSFIATANSIRYCGATPVFVDIDPSTFNLSPTLIERAVTQRTRAILCVHQMGMPCDLASMVRIARRHHLAVVEDAACAAGSEIKWHGRWEKIGRPHGDIACFSFHPRKLLTTGDGGMLTTRDPLFDRKFRLWRQHAMSVSDSARHKERNVIFEEYRELGYNYRMTDIQAAVGRIQLGKLPCMVSSRRKLAARYNLKLGRIPGLTMPAQPAWARSNWQSFCVRLPESCDQQKVMQYLLDAGIATRRGIMCTHLESAYRHEPWSSARGKDPRDLRESEKARNQCVILPLFHGMKLVDVDRIASILQRACAC